MSGYKLLASDIDGTLTNDGLFVSARVRRAIAALHERGKLFTLCTGRNIDGARRFLPLVSQDVPVITYHGSVIATVTGEVLYECRLEEDCTRRIVELGWDKARTLLVWHGGRMHCNARTEQVVNYERICGESAVLVVAASELAGISASKIIWFGSPDENAAHIRLLDSMDTAGFTYYTSHPSFLEFVSDGISKGRALDRLAGMLGLDKSEIIAAGDGMNDVSMIEYAGLGAVMGDAPEALKSVADYVAPACGEDGLADIIERFML